MYLTWGDLVINFGAQLSNYWSIMLCWCMMNKVWEKVRPKKKSVGERIANPKMLLWSDWQISVFIHDDALSISIFLQIQKHERKKSGRIEGMLKKASNLLPTAHCKFNIWTQFNKIIIYIYWKRRVNINSKIIKLLQ